MSKKLLKDNVDLIDLILLLWKYKIYIITFILISFAIVFINQQSIEPKKITATTEIKPISVYDEAKYRIYNSVINTIKPYYVIEDVTRKIIEGKEQLNFSYESTNTKANQLLFNNIDKKFLLELFIDTLNQRSNLVSVIKKFDSINKDNYSTKIKYEEAVNKFASSIKLIEYNDKNYIEIETDNLDILENFLIFLEKKTNLHIQDRLSLIFNDYLNYVEAVNKYQIEDIEAQISVTTNKSQISNFRRQVVILKSNKYIERLNSIFASSPISNPDSFYAAKINFNSISYKIDNKPSVVVKYLVAGICGAIFGIFFVLIINAIQKRR
jgi:LPS O-antigen subunit length determinant protein (WzzB/FepE family)